MSKNYPNPQKMIMFGKQSDYNSIISLFEVLSSDATEKQKIIEISDCIRTLLEFAEKYKIKGNLWKNYLSFLMINDENPFSLACERKEPENGSLKFFALKDAEILNELFFFDFAQTEKELNIDYFSNISDFSFTTASRETSFVTIGNFASSLTASLNKAKNADEFLTVLAQSFSRNGVGFFGLNKAFFVTDNGTEYSLSPITEFLPVSFSDLWGYDDQKKRLIDNTIDFIEGRHANNVLLYGDSGTGKSTCIKAVLNRFCGEGLRMIEVTKYQFKFLTRIIEQIKNRGFSFIIYIDDLSFEDFEVEYKYLKSVIEGGLEPKPNNILIYATSNRRHLIKENWSDKNDGDSDVHRSDTVQEKLSLADRFGVSISFMKPLQNDYQKIVIHLARLYNIDISEKDLLDGARIWALSHGGMTGRAAQQYINTLSGKSEK